VDLVEEISEDESNGEEEELDDNPPDFITAQYERVQRTKQKYKCVFKDVIIHIKGKDYVVKKVNADIEY
jgi:transcription initiation factor TFIIA large subunit